MILFSLMCDVMIITGVYNKMKFSTNINLALANCKGVISFVRLGLLILHLIIVQVRHRWAYLKLGFFKSATLLYSTCTVAAELKPNNQSNVYLISHKK